MQENSFFMLIIFCDSLSSHVTRRTVTKFYWRVSSVSCNNICFNTQSVMALLSSASQASNELKQDSLNININKMIYRSGYSIIDHFNDGPRKKQAHFLVMQLLFNSK